MPTSNQTVGALHVLVVDDDADTAESLAELLTIYGHTVRVALDGPSALHQVEVGRPDVVLLDLRMPGMDGCEVARLIRERYAAREKRPLLVAVTGCAVADALLRSAHGRFDLHLVKPVEPTAMIEVLKRFRQVFCPGIPETEFDQCLEEESAARSVYTVASVCV